MSTRSDIIVHLTNGQFARVYCHFDGYPKHHGPILLKSYNSQERAEELIRHGGISVLDHRCDLPADPTPRADDWASKEVSTTHTFDNPAKGFTIYFGRDRGEDDDTWEAQTFNTLDEATADLNEYTYIWQDSTWWVIDHETGVLKALTEVVHARLAKGTPR